VAWFDGRALPQAEWLDQMIGRDRLFAISGLSLQPIFGLCKLLWLKQNEPESFARTVLWLNVADYIAYRLCGVPATDYSLASRTLCLNLRELHWDIDLLQELEIPVSLFAPLTSSGLPLGQVKADATLTTGLPSSAQVVVGGHDHVCGALAAEVIEPGSLLDSVGTTEAVFLPIDQPLSDPAVGRQGYAQSVHVVRGHYYLLGGLYTGGICVDWFRNLLGADMDHAALIAEAEAIPPGSHGVNFLPYLRLANPPINDPEARGAFVGLTTDAGRGTLFRALLEGLAFELRHSIEALLAHTNVDPRAIYATGGGTRNRLHMQIKATVLSQTINVIEMEEATALGAAMLAGLGAGVYPDVPTALNTLQVAHTVLKPMTEHIPLYDTLYLQIYRQMYQTLRPLNHAIHSLSG
jgi:xylulokinase